MSTILSWICRGNFVLCHPLLMDPVVDDDNPYVPLNSPAIGDLFDFFHFDRDGAENEN